MNDSINSLLNNILKLEYTLIIHYPRLASMIRDKEIRNLVNALGTASVKHADVVTRAINHYGGSPVWSFEPFPGDDKLVTIFKKQLEKEETALELHRQSALMVTDPTLKSDFEELAREEESHIKTVKEVLKRLEERGEGQQKPRSPQFF